MTDISVLQYANTLLLAILSYFAKRTLDRVEESITTIRAQVEDHETRITVTEAGYATVKDFCAIRHAKP